MNQSLWFLFGFGVALAAVITLNLWWHHRAEATEREFDRTLNDMTNAVRRLTGDKP